MRKRLKVLTVGCKANFADSASVVRLGAGAGFRVVPPASPADVIVINSCTVTHRADRDTRSLARKARRENPGATIILAGCFARVTSPDVLPEVDHWIGGNGTEAEGPGDGPLSALLSGIAGEGGEQSPVLSDHAADLLLGHRRTFLKIQDGCDSSCAYCVVPLARGGNRSVPAEEILARAAEAERDGARELVLTGIHIGRYGADSGKKDALAALVSRLLDETSLLRFRLSSVEPGELTDRLIGTIAGDPRMCAHLHVPLQSGCDRTLARMRRPYRAAEYEEATVAAVARIPDLCLGADVIAGFPGETPQDFEETLRFLEDSPVAYLHAFPYSARPGTESAGMADDVSPGEKKARVAGLINLGARKKEAFLAGQVGRTVEVLAERAGRRRGALAGKAGNYADVLFSGDAAGVGEIHRVGVEGVRDGKLFGRRAG